MSFRHLVKIGRHRINPDKIIRIEDLAQAQAGGPPAYAMIMDPGDTLTFAGEDAEELRRILEESDATPEGEASGDNGSPSTMLTGHGGPLARPTTPGHPGSVAE